MPKYSPIGRRVPDVRFAFAEPTARRPWDAGTVFAYLVPTAAILVTAVVLLIMLGAIR